jgi:cyclophilin family peptidyl-prolyl cis-trans isomerase
MKMLKLTMLVLAGLALTAQAKDKPVAHSKSSTEILAESRPGDWRPLDLENTLYFELPEGRVVMELAPAFAPLHVENIKTLVKEKYFDGLVILRSHDNYVVQWGDPSDDEVDTSLPPKSQGSAKPKLPPEFTVPISAATPFTRLKDFDGYAAQAGFSNGFPVGRNPKTKQTWLTHCYGAIGVGRGNDLDSGNGSSLYVVIGNGPRHLDRNIAVVGRVVQGVELLSAMPRGPAPMGFYANPEQRVTIKSIRLATDVPASERTNLEVLRTESPTFAAVTEARRNRRDDWYVQPAGYISLCNATIPVRPIEH